MKKPYAKIGSASIRVIEEASEVIKELCKCERFGWFNYHPGDPRKLRNMDRVVLELQDLEYSIQDLKKDIIRMSKERFHEQNHS